MQVWSRIFTMPTYTTIIWMYQRVATEDDPEITCVLDVKRENMAHIIKEEQAHRVQVAVLSQMQLQAREWVEKQEKEL